MEAAMTFLADALALAANGWEVLPLAGKVPLTRHGVHDATSTSAQIERWWRRWPTANIGGAVPLGVVVLDVDPRNGGQESWSEVVDGREVPETLTTLSGRGDGGMHLYFLRPGGELSARAVPPGIDLKTAGYCVLPPSVHPDTGGAYEWRTAPIVPMPTWLREVLRPERLPRTRLGMGRSFGSLNALVAFVASQAPGNRNSALYWAARRAWEQGLLDQEFEESLVAAAVLAGESESAAKRTVASARREHVS
jgi:hypothetical protein